MSSVQGTFCKRPLSSAVLPLYERMEKQKEEEGGAEAVEEQEDVIRWPQLTDNPIDSTQLASQLPRRMLCLTIFWIFWAKRV